MLSCTPGWCFWSKLLSAQPIRGEKCNCRNWCRCFRMFTKGLHCRPIMYVVLRIGWREKAQFVTSSSWWTKLMSNGFKFFSPPQFFGLFCNCSCTSFVSLLSEVVLLFLESVILFPKHFFHFTSSTIRVLFLFLSCSCSHQLRVFLIASCFFLSSASFPSCNKSCYPKRLLQRLLALSFIGISWL